MEISFLLEPFLELRLGTKLTFLEQIVTHKKTAVDDGLPSVIKSRKQLKKIGWNDICLHQTRIQET